MDPMSVAFLIFVIIFGIVVISLFIESAVKRGINNSIVGQYLKEKGFKEHKKKSFFGSDLDNDR
jgi:hypothetical protein